VKNSTMKAIGSSAVSGINSIKWVDYATWMSKPEGAKGMVLGGVYMACCQVFYVKGWSMEAVQDILCNPCRSHWTTLTYKSEVLSDVK